MYDLSIATTAMNGERNRGKYHSLPFHFIHPPPKQDDSFTTNPNYLVSLFTDTDQGHNRVLSSYKRDVYGIAGEAARFSKQYEVETTHSPYLNRIREAAASGAYPDLEFLAEWMEVGTAPSRWEYLTRHPEDRKVRLAKCNACVLDFSAGEEGGRAERKAVIRCGSVSKLEEAIEHDWQSGKAKEERRQNVRLVVVEDLSRDTIELLGSRFNVDPHFFRSQLNDYLFYENRDPAVERPRLRSIRRKAAHFHVQHLRPRFYQSAAAFDKATHEASVFNVLRRIDSHRTHRIGKDRDGSLVTLMRTNTSVWIQPPRDRAEDGSLVAILLVDPTVRQGYPLWNGYGALEHWPADEHSDLPRPPRISLYEDVIYWTSRWLSGNTVNEMIRSPNTVALQMLSLVTSDWQILIKYITARLGEIEWEIELPAMRQNESSVDETLKKLHPWRRNVPLYRTMIADAIDAAFSREMQNRQQDDSSEDGLMGLLCDFQDVLQDMDRIQERIERIVSVATALVSIEEGRRGMEQNKNVTRLTYLATIFIPLSFVTGFFSMAPNLADLKQTISIYFAVAVPLTALAMLIADF
ncbi:hypothetical protein K431DRAFT_247701, partial [Polychaeton citri CBS 116435]